MVPRGGTSHPGHRSHWEKALLMCEKCKQLVSRHQKGGWGRGKGRGDMNKMQRDVF